MPGRRLEEAENAGFLNAVIFAARRAGSKPRFQARQLTACHPAFVPQQKTDETQGLRNATLSETWELQLVRVQQPLQLSNHGNILRKHCQNFVGRLVKQFVDSADMAVQLAL